MGNESILVSISCITYNHAPYIRQCLDGFMMQKTNFAFEVLIHDDASTDGTTEIIKEYEAKYPDVIKPLYEEENQWVKGRRGSAVFNYPRAKGKYIALCEGDDYWTDPFKLQKQVDFLEANPEYGMCYTKSQAYYQVKATFGPVFGGETPNNFKSIAIENRIPTQTVIFRTLCLRQYLLEIDSSDKNWKMGDYPMYLWFAYNSKIHFIPECTATYRCLPQSAAHFRTRNEWIRFRINAFEISRYFTEKYDPTITPSVDEILHWYYLELSIFNIDKENASNYREIVTSHPNNQLSIKQKLLIYGSYCPKLYVVFFRIYKFIQNYKIKNE